MMMLKSVSYKTYRRGWLLVLLERRGGAIPISVPAAVITVTLLVAVTVPVPIAAAITIII